MNDFELHENGDYNLEIEIISKWHFAFDFSSLEDLSNSLESQSKYMKKLDYDLKNKTIKHEWSGDPTWKTCSFWVKTLDDVEYFHKEHDAWLQIFYFEGWEWCVNPNYVKQKKGCLTRDLKKNWRKYAQKIDMEIVDNYHEVIDIINN